VGQYLVAQGIMSARVVAKGLGERFPIASNESESGRQQNRRVELRLIPLTE
jgi:outer membrane protein OmpA-like peptidoglycan-associated protein